MFLSLIDRSVVIVIFNNRYRLSMLGELLTLDLDANVLAIKNIAMLISENRDQNFFFFNVCGAAWVYSVKASMTNINYF